MTEMGMFVYPWDIGRVDEFFQDYEATRSNAVAPALSYHHGNVLQARSGRVQAIPRAAVSFAPEWRLYGDVRPSVHEDAADRGVVHSLRQWCRDSGRHFSAWTVVLHNSTIGSARPDLCVMNQAGDRYPHALCPSNPEVRRYARALLQDILGQFAPDSVLVESAGYRTALHGEHHEIANTRVGTAALWLLSLCFCPHCLEAASGRAGLDGEKARAAAGRLILHLLNNEVVVDGDDFSMVTSLLLEYPDLYHYQRERQKRVAEFVQDLGDVVRGRGVEYRVIPCATPFQLSASFLEGFSYTDNAARVDTLMPLLYSPGEGWERVRDTIRMTAPDTALGMVVTLHPARYPGRDDFLGAVRDAAGPGERPRCVYVYNYSIASRERLGWLTAAADILNPPGDGHAGL